MPEQKPSTSGRDTLIVIGVIIVVIYGLVQFVAHTPGNTPQDYCSSTDQIQGLC